MCVPISSFNLHLFEVCMNYSISQVTKHMEETKGLQISLNFKSSEARVARLVLVIYYPLKAQLLNFMNLN